MARGRGTRLSKSWTGATSGSVVSVGGGTQQVLLSVSVAESAGQQNTLLRSRGQILVQATPDAASDAEVMGFGLIVVHSNALAIGTTSLPGPIADIGADWLWYDFVPFDAVVDTAGSANDRGIIHRLEIDSKAMRRVPNDHSVVLMAEASITAFASVSAIAGCRFLFGS